jgi:hypothetical protein
MNATNYSEIYSEALAFIASNIDSLKAIPMPGLSALAVNSVAIWILQELKPTGTGYAKSITRMVLRSLQFSITTFLMSIPASPFTAAGVGLVMSAANEWYAARQKSYYETISRRHREQMAQQVLQRAEQEQQLAKAIAKKKWEQAPNTQLDQLQRLRLQAAADARINETRACVSADSTERFKFLAEFLGQHQWVPYYPEKLMQGTSEAVLRVITTHDDVGAFDQACYTEHTILWRLAMRYIIYEKRVSSVAEINRAIDWVREKNKTIKLLWMGAHGNRNGMAFSERTTQGRGLQGIHFHKLDPRAAIWLHSCKTGARPNGDKLSPAEWTKLKAGAHRRVFAPIEVTHSMCFELLDTERCTVAIYELGTGESMTRILSRQPNPSAQTVIDWTQLVPDYSKPTTVEPDFEPTIKRFMKHEKPFLQRPSLISLIARAIRKVFCCRRPRF